MKIDNLLLLVCVMLPTSVVIERLFPAFVRKNETDTEVVASLCCYVSKIIDPIGYSWNAVYGGMADSLPNLQNGLF
ncbi:MAG: hypothetical protein EHM40_13325 [Chloroflexi bacterium]|nr:MAG: hypothetical protein EHM40_13325 [Chloroflexota bacterium]